MASVDDKEMANHN